MDKNTNSKSWYTKWWIWAIVIVVLGGIGYAANPDSANKSTNDTSAPKTETPPPKQWTKVSELIGDTKEKSGDTFTSAGGNLRIKYMVNTTSDSGTALLYLLPEGSTITKNAKGEMDIAVQELTTIGNNTGEKIIQKPQGNYYVYINTSSVKDYSITVEEQK